MNEETTQNLPSFEARIIAAIADMRAEMRERLMAVETRLTALEEQAAVRSRETRPIWEAVLSRLEIMDHKFDRVAADLLQRFWLVCSVSIRLSPNTGGLQLLNTQGENAVTARAETDVLKKRLPPAA